MKNKKLFYIVGTTLITIFLLYITDQILHLNYVSKVMVKIILFSLFPIIYIIWTKDNFVKDSFFHLQGKFCISNWKSGSWAMRVLTQRSRFSCDKKRFSVKLSYTLGVLIFIIIIVAFHWFRQYMNITVLIFEFEEKYKINKSNILYYGIYLALVNSLLEEFFFRGFIFLSLKKIGMKRVAYLTSSIAFAIYHVGNFQNWFNIWVFVLATTGLFIGGMIFNYLDDHENTFLNSWYVHICADLALVGIGLSIFQVI